MGLEALAGVRTVAEIVREYQVHPTQVTALLSGVLLTIFALTMAMALGIKAPLDFSVFSAAAGALLLGMCTDFPFSLDELLRRNRQGSDLRMERQLPERD